MELDDAACMDLLCDFVLCPTFGSSESAGDDDESHAQPPAKRSRKREAHHIAALRATVADLVAQRDALTARKQRATQSPWEATSRRQAAARFAVEQEHAQLTRAVAAQARVLTSLQAVLARPQLIDMPLLAPRLLDAPSSLRRATAEALVHAEYGRLESIVLSSKIHEATSRVQNTSITYDESAHAIRVDCTMAQMHNLTVDQCALAIWKYYNNLVPIEVKDTSFVVLEEWDANLSYGRLIMETPGVEIHCHVVQKRFLEPNRVVICSATIAHDEKFPYDPDAYVLHESTWFVHNTTLCVIL
ncbi:hypothetical protein SPRG_20985 [Saprolegnia parasitica CBS 223.65]|uniref:START domain-containing protein n=1 Tax=Saprolegnia parasitica (strain CBS 223.65) TaxID=695850 RepID=A0A067BYB4_SAPPC|nr:hypothetical protein SPRG_20985 [Saprolegnia parasitica CBS 223.65]KDO23238.1 hypothetical protein SPRG_20985 [Saprolegnia parasitica CBS 223.65]|eukprot:XP_012206072.1 hypothetical protein SPRG_20985 [Saprolegnia parasitica CBS 223.65]